LEQLWSSIWRTATERVQLSSRLELVTEAKVSNLDVEVTVKQEIFRLSPTTTTDVGHHLVPLFTALKPLHYITLHYSTLKCLQCFHVVGWVAGRASGL